MSEAQIVRRIELPLALPTIFGGIRLAAVAVLATAIIAPLAGVRDARHADASRSTSTARRAAVGAAIVVATLTLVADAGFALVQRLVTPKGLKIARGRPRQPRFLPTPSRRVQTP